MTAHVIVTPEARADLAEAAAWYRERSIRAAEEFLLAVSVAFARIESQPTARRRPRPISAISAVKSIDLRVSVVKLRASPISNPINHKDTKAQRRPAWSGMHLRSSA